MIARLTLFGVSVIKIHCPKGSGGSNPPLGVYFNKMGVATELEKGKYFLHNNEPMRVTRKEVVAVGTHSHTKLKIFYQGVEGRGEKTIILGHTDKVDILDITRKQGQVISKNNDKVQIMDLVSYEVMEAKAIPEIMDDFKEGLIVTFINFNGDCRIVDIRGSQKEEHS